MAADEAVTSILRIKRKRTAAGTPLDALVIEDSLPPFKRRRNRQPDSPSTPAESRGIFRFAETVSLDSFDTANKTRQVRDRITAFLHHPPTPLSRVSSSSSIQRLASVPGSSAPASPSRKLPGSVRAARAGAVTSVGVEPKDRIKEEQVSGFLEHSKRARYRIIERHRGGGDADQWGKAQEKVNLREGPRPPEVLSVAEAKERAQQKQSEATIKIYDAVEEELSTPSQQSGFKAKVIPSSNGDDDDLMNNFVPMLQEYLTLNDSLASLPPADEVNATASDEEANSDEFVYDVYYRDFRPDSATLAIESNDNNVSNGAGLRRIGELAGLEDDEILTEEISSEEEDFADQDSNDENDYRNDYPATDESDVSDEDRYEG